MSLIVDTNVFIDAENERLDLSRLTILQSETVYIAVITVSELLAGVQLAKTADVKIHRHAFVENILNSVPALDFNTEVARTYAELYSFALAKRQRSKLNAHDLQIAATALVYGYSILTTNIADFENIPRVDVINPYQFHNEIHEGGEEYST